MDATTSTDESHQITSRSEQNGGVILLRSGHSKCVALLKVSHVTKVCFCDAKLCFHSMLQHPKAILRVFFCVWYTAGVSESQSTPH